MPDDDIVCGSSRELLLRIELNRRFTHDRYIARLGGMGDGTFQRTQFRRRASFKRVLKVASAMAAAPDQSLPKQHPAWGDLKAAYGFFNNSKVTPAELQRTHREQVRAACADQDRILVVQDGSELDFSNHPSVKGLSFIGNGAGRGLLQHSSLAVTTDGQLQGVLHQIWWKRVKTPEGETRRQRQARYKESDLWSDSIRAVAELRLAPRTIHVADRGGDGFDIMHTAQEAKSGFLIRARHDRCVNDGSERLWAFMQRQPIAGTRDVCVPRRPSKKGKPAQPARVARLAVRFAPVWIPRPHQASRSGEPLSIWAVYIVETDPPEGIDPIEWMLLTSEAVENIKDANERVDWYTYRWLIEEWHKAVKTGCRLERSQLKDADALERLAALTAVVSVRLIQLRELAQAQLGERPTDPTSPSEQPTALQALVPWTWIIVVSHLAHCGPRELTPRLFWHTIAKRGGFIGRKGDSMPGWQTIWKGWSEVMLLVAGFELQPIIKGVESYG
jgi:hypothetical protein